jgi:hypothetical protein
MRYAHLTSSVRLFDAQFCAHLRFIFTFTSSFSYLFYLIFDFMLIFMLSYMLPYLCSHVFVQCFRTV